MWQIADSVHPSNLFFRSSLYFSLFHTWPLVVGPRVKLQSLLSLVSVAGTRIYILKIREQACLHKASSVHSLFDFCSSSPNLTLKRENTSPFWESVPVCKGKRERKQQTETDCERERLRTSLDGGKPKQLTRRILQAGPLCFSRIQTWPLLARQTAADWGKQINHFLWD